MTSPSPAGRITAYVLSLLLTLCGFLGVYLRHYLYCGILSVFIFGIGFALFLLLLIKDKTSRKTARIFSLTFHILFSVFLISFVIIEVPVIRDARKAVAREVITDEDIHMILVPGAGLIPHSEEPSLLYRIRLDRAAELYYNEPTLEIVVCGGQGDDEAAAEATAGQHYLYKKGLPESAVVAETESLDTAENFRNFRILFPEEEHIALVSNDFHIHRCTKLAERYGLDVIPFSVPTPKFFLRVNYFMREYVSLIIFAIESKGIIIDTSNFHI